MSLLNINPESYTVPSGLALIYKDVNLYKYKIGSNTVGELSSVMYLTRLGIDSSSLPVLVYQNDLLEVLGNAPIEVDTALSTIATTKKSYYDYIGRVANKKLDKPTFLTEVENLRSSIKAMGDTSLPSGGNVGQVLTKTEEGYEWQDSQGGSGLTTVISGEVLVFSSSSSGSSTATVVDQILIL